MSQENHLNAKSGETCFLSFFTNQGCILSTPVAEEPRKRVKVNLASVLNAMGGYMLAQTTAQKRVQAAADIQRSGK